MKENVDHLKSHEAQLKLTDEHVGFAQEQIVSLQHGLSGVRLNIKELHSALQSDHQVLLTIYLL
jgi:hypothetical protein